MKLSKRLLSTAVIILLLLTLLFAFGYLNSMVSYKYEVQDSLFAGQTLNKYQKDILHDIRTSEIEAIACAIISGLLMIIRLNEPTFKGKVFYV